MEIIVNFWKQPDNLEAPDFKPLPMRLLSRFGQDHMSIEKLAALEATIFPLRRKA